MLRSGMPTTALSFTSVLKVCSFETKLLCVGQGLHAIGFRVGVVGDALVSSSLVGFYSKFGLVEAARKGFDEMDRSCRDSVLWGIMIKAYCQLGLQTEAILLFSEMRRDGMCDNHDGPSSVFITGVSGKNLELIKAIWIKACLFDIQSDVIALNKSMTEHLKLREFSAVFRLFMQMRRLAVGYDNVTFVCVISASTFIKCIEFGKQIHNVVLKIGFHHDLSVSNNIINMYSKLGFLHSAGQVFDEMKDRDLISWNSMISSYTRDGFEEGSIALFFSMLENGIVPDEFTLSSILRACSASEIFSSLCEPLHCCVLKMGLDSDTFVLTGLVSVYAKNGSVAEAELLATQMDCYDLGICNALISGYVAIGNNFKALDFFFVSMPTMTTEAFDHYTLGTVLKACGALVAFTQGKQIHTYAIKSGYVSDLCVSSGILDMYLKCGDTEKAFMIFSTMSDPDSVAWTAMISGCVENGDEDHGFNLYHQMVRSGIVPNKFILTSVVKACSFLAALDQGRQLHANALKMDCLSDDYVGTSIVDMYAKCGNIEDSYLVFKGLDTRSLSSWNAMVVGLSQHGHAKEALGLFDEMRECGLKPDKITFIGVLSACSHSGKVSEAYGYFESMSKDYKIPPEIEHYSCLVDVLSRAGLFMEAENIMETMPFEASASMYTALLGACSRDRGGNYSSEIGERMAKRLLCLEPIDSSAYVLLSNIYATSHQWDEADEVRMVMKRRGVKKDPGYSWLEAEKKVHLFVVDDRSHPEADSIYKKVDELMSRIKDAGYVPDTDLVVHNVEEEEKERCLYYHSEKLAVAYGLITSPPTLKKIRIIKNLRVCGDCHTAIKYISKLVNREFVIRDANRFHHFFTDGHCSCGDYW